VSCLDIVFSDDEEAGIGPVGPKKDSIKPEKPAPAPTAMKKVQRSAKANAISALNRKSSDHSSSETSTPNQASTSSNGIKPSTLSAQLSNVINSQSQPHPSKNPYRKSLNFHHAPSIPIDELRTKSPFPRTSKPLPRPFGQQRIFNLEEGPTYYPTVEEFQKPMEYIEKVVREGAKDYGIFKVVPPDGWQLPFTMDTEVGFSKSRSIIRN
jgi:[histone H3]-trimethyl-L-lysine4 demethylase